MTGIPTSVTAHIVALHDPEILAHLDPVGVWAQLRAIGLVERERRVGDRVTVECHHYLLSAPLSSAAFDETYLTTIRNATHCRRIKMQLPC